MKVRNLIIFIFAVITLSMTAQTRLIRLHLQSGSTICYDLAKLDSIDFIVSEEGSGVAIDTLYVDPESGVTTGDAAEITCYTANVAGRVEGLDAQNDDERSIGILYTTDSIPYQANSKRIDVTLADANEDGEYVVNLADLVPMTTYRYRACYKENGIWWYGAVKTFTTLGQGVSFETYDAGSVTCFSAKIASKMIIEEQTNYKTLSYGVCFATEQDTTVNDSVALAVDRDSDGMYSVMLTGLKGKTTYYYRPYAVVDGYVNYGALGVFTTKEDDVVTMEKIDEATKKVAGTLNISGGPYTKLVPGVCYGFGEKPTIEDHVVITDEIDSETQTYQVTLSNITMGTWYYRAFVVIDGAVHYGKVRRMNADTKQRVDLGLSVKWASCNVGAAAPTDNGDYYAWAEITPKEDYSMSNYRWMDEESGMLTKYCTLSTAGEVDDIKVISPSDDAATASWGGAWRMPTYEEMTELKNECYWQWTTDYNGTGVAGYAVYKTKSDAHKGQNNTANPGYDVYYTYEDVHIFMPAAGYRNNSGIYSQSVNGYYWTAQINEAKPKQAWTLRFLSNNMTFYSRTRNSGCSIRPVCVE